MNGLVAFAMAAVLGQAEQKPLTTDVERADETVRLARIEGLRYRIEYADDAQVALEMRQAPILKWSNPSEGALFGSVMLWTVEGRPEAVASIYRWFVDREESHAEFKSLSTHGLKAARDGAAIWDAQPPDVEFHPLPESPAPQDTANKRLAQMRETARRFAAKLTHPQKGATALRLLTQPVYRYEQPSGDLLDGALFAFVQGTDPEVFLFVEAAKSAAGPQWRYALARMNMFQLQVTLDGKEVWKADELTWNKVASRQGPYTIIVLDKQPAPAAP
jgi:hypothetical protein